MDWKALFDLAVTVVLLLGGIVGRMLWEANRSLQRDLKSLATQLGALECVLPDRYVRRDDWREAVDRIERAVERIELKLDTKADKP